MMKKELVVSVCICLVVSCDFPHSKFGSHPLRTFRSPKSQMQNCYGLLNRFARSISEKGISVAIVFFLASCAGPVKSLYPPRASEAHQTVYVINHGTLHTGVAVKRSDIPHGIWPASQDYSGSKYLEVGWGDDEGYRKPLTTAIVFKAMTGSKQTVMLSDGFNAVQTKIDTPKFSVIAVDLSTDGFARLCRHIEQTYAIDQKGEPIRLGKGWYRARGTYSMFNTCNSWVARGLRKAGCPITPAYCLTPGPLLFQVRQFGRVLRQTTEERSRER